MYGPALRVSVKFDIGYLFQFLSTLLFETGSLTDLRTHSVVRLAGWSVSSCDPLACFPLPPQLGLHMHIVLSAFYTDPRDMMLT